MPAGIRVTVTFPTPPGCPVAEFSEAADATVDSVTTTVASADSANTLSEFLVDAEAVPDDCERTPVFAYADRRVYRVDHDADCPCVCLGEYDTPVHRYFADGETLELVFHARDFELLQTVVGELRERFPDVDIQRLVRAPTGGASQDTVFVDRGKLTDRQLEVLRTAYEMGYFEQPRGANATEIADELGVSPSTVTEHLLAAQSKLLQDVLERGS
ncbi:helix-turn-helix domain-containing protein [Halosimplex aquaticum]|uniref:Helix-turn-helix domain-containing protein n=1 Tax=Halosimplex aquaticum TaxID=3026162 RepID=A0ABD5XYS7_9EURY|nr:helix-turn-helix domain-containing protein [Halosimplex aquaticum]